jgi:hypothetical protein
VKGDFTEFSWKFCIFSAIFLLFFFFFCSRFGSVRFGFGPVWVRSGLGLVRFWSGPDRLMWWVRSVPGARWRVSGMCWHVLVRGRSYRRFHRRVAAPVRLFFMPFFKSDDEDPDGGVNCSIRCQKGRFWRPLGRLRVVARGASLPEL